MKELGDRPWHVLRGLKGDRLPELCIFVDTEANERDISGECGVHELTFRLGCASAVWFANGHPVHREEVCFSRSSEFWHYIDSRSPRRGTTWIFAHNLGFDLTLLGFWAILTRKPDILQLAILEDPPTIIKTREGRRVWQLVDTLNYWRAPLADLGRSVGLPKLPMPEPTAPDSDWFAYCRRDVEILEALICSLIAFTRETLSCSFRATAASLAWCAWRSSTCWQPPLIHGNYRALGLERQSLFGGRSECCRLGHIRQPVAVLDCNSLYPAIMAEERLPCQLVSLTRQLKVRDLRACLNEYLCIADVILGPDHPPVPQRGLGGPCYHGGAGWFTLCGPELGRCLAADAVRGLRCTALFGGAVLFRSFVDPLYARKVAARQSGDLAAELCTKLVLNGLSGKFAQRGRRWVNDESLTAPDLWSFWWSRDVHTGQPVRCRSLAGVRARLVSGPEPYNTAPAISSFIASYGRCRLAAYRDVVGEVDTCYTDTDAVHVLARGAYRLNRAGMVSRDALGKLRVQAIGADAEYWGPKHYRVGSLLVTGSLAHHATPLGDGRYQQTVFPGIESILVSEARDSIRTVDRLVRLLGMGQTDPPNGRLSTEHGGN